MTNKIQAGYTVVINEDGTIKTHVLPADENVQRTATTFDIYQTSKELVSDIESQLLADRVARTVLANLQPKDSAAELKEKLLNALSDRGIDTPQA
jgi:capsular polysaccharide biosynthesis protein